MRYIVKLDYKQFIFDNAEAAMIFAETAKKAWHATERYENTELSVTIEIELDVKED